MAGDEVSNDRLTRLLEQLISLTERGEVHWERQVGSAHRYARWNNNLLILGPSQPAGKTTAPRYLFITPFDSPACVEISSDDKELGGPLMELVSTVERTSKNEPPTDPFGLSEEVLSRLTSG